MENQGEPTFGEGALTHCPYHPDVKLDHVSEEYDNTDILETISCQKCNREFEIRYRPMSWRELP